MQKLCIIILLFNVLIGFTWAAERELKLENTYLNLPVTYDENDFTSIEIVINGKSEFYIDLYFADEEPEFWVFLDVSAFKGKSALIKVDREDKSDALKNIYQSDERTYLKNVYKEK